MEIVDSLNALRRKRLPIVLAVGFFDGVHVGHARVLARARAEAAREGGRVWVLTFARHPRRVVGNGAAPRLLTTNRHKLILLKRLGIDGCVLLPFSRALAGLEPEAFVRRLGSSVPRLRALCVGRSWRFGRDGEGDTSLLARLGRVHGFRVCSVPAVRRGGGSVSSTRIRAAVADGDLAGAARLLGRPFSILGTVRPGAGIGRTLGYPTANLDPHNEVLPPRGVYAVAARLGRRVRGGVLNYGRRPTVASRARRDALELHLPGYRGDLYGRDIEVAFVEHLRPEKAFASLEALKRQIGRDAACAMRRLPAALLAGAFES